MASPIKKNKPNFHRCFQTSCKSLNVDLDFKNPLDTYIENIVHDWQSNTNNAKIRNILVMPSVPHNENDNNCCFLIHFS